MSDNRDLAPPDYCDPVIEVYKKNVDRAALRENLKLTVEQRFEKAQELNRLEEERRKAEERAWDRIIRDLQALLEERQKRESGS